MQNKDKEGKKDALGDLHDNYLRRLTLAMMLHPRLNANSLFRLLDEEMVQVIAGFFPKKKIVQAFFEFELAGTGVAPNLNTVQLLGGVLAEWHADIKGIRIITDPLGMDIFLRPEPDSENFYSMLLMAASYDDDGKGYASDDPDRVPLQYLQINIRDPVITDMMNPDDALRCQNVASSDIHIVSPDGSVHADFSCDPEDDPLLLTTKGYHVVTEGDELRSLINGLLQIVFAEERRDKTNRCPQCLQPIMGEGGMPGTLCITCLRANSDQA